MYYELWEPSVNTYVNIKQLNEVVEKTAQAIEDGKREIFDISEKAASDCKSLEQELSDISIQAQLVIKAVDDLELKEKLSRIRLLNVSKNFNDFSEADIKKAYDYAKDLQVKLSLKRQEEKDLFKERTRLEIRLKDSIEVMKKAESLTAKVSMAINLLRTGFTEQFEDMKQKQDMGLRIIEAQEAERKRVSRDIHDGPAQVMANVVLKAEYCEKIIDDDVAGTKLELQGLKETVRESLRDIRKIIYDLLPMSLADLGLAPTLEKLIRDFEKETGIRVGFKSEQVRIKPMKQLIEVTLFRIVQESLTNIRKHSRADQAQIRISLRNEEIELHITDNGTGFDTSVLTENQDPDRGYGLYSMRERVDLLKGNLVLDSALGKGTTIHVSIPQSDEED